jgi:hypothetical protein
MPTHRGGGLALDVAMFSNAADDGAHLAGLLNGVARNSIN